MKIYIDMDGVLANFAQRMIDVFGWDITHDEIRRYDIFRDFGLTKTQFFEKIKDTSNFWLDIKPYDNAKALLETCAIEGDVHIISTPSIIDLNSWSQKAEWVSRHFPKYVNKLTLTFEKIGTPNDVLIDDYPINLKTWLGRGILYPQPWNQTNESPSCL